MIAPKQAPKNVFYFEVLLYASLTLDALSVAFQDRSMDTGLTESTIMAANVVAACMILLFMFLVSLAAERRKSWPRYALGFSLMFSLMSLLQILGETGLQLDSAIETVSCALTAAGLYFSFTGDAKNWFTE